MSALGTNRTGASGRRERGLFVEEGAVPSVVSTGPLRRMHTAVLVHLHVHIFALHLEYRRVRDVSAHIEQ